jgi:hypothetical protein
MSAACPVTGYHPSVCGCDYHLAEAGITVLEAAPSESQTIMALSSDEPAF